MAPSRAKFHSATDAIDAISSGMTVALSSLSSEPLSLTSALWERGARLHDVTVVSGMMLTGYPFLTGAGAGAFKLRTWFMPGTLLGGAAHELKADFLPLSWAQTVRYLEAQSFDVVLIQVGPADAEGRHSLGINTSQMRAMLKSAKLVIAEVNEAMPRTCGDSLIDGDVIDILVEADHALPEFPHRDGDEIDRSIGRHAAELIADGSTLQFGIGTIPGATLDGLISLQRRHLRIVSQLTDPARRLIESGCCVEDNPKAIVGDILGTADLYRWVDRNPAIHMTDGFTTHSIEGLKRREKFVSVNSGLEIDLYGQLNSESLDGRQAGGIGGSIDFAIGAQLEGGRSIIALRSRTKRGGARIVPRLMAGPVTVPRTLVQFVVTEHGVADLRNRTVHERATALASIAHPDDRAALLEAAAALQ
jgi:acyl-CoA hydrolase